MQWTDSYNLLLFLSFEIKMKICQTKNFLNLFITETETFLIIFCNKTKSILTDVSEEKRLLSKCQVKWNYVECHMNVGKCYFFLFSSTYTLRIPFFFSIVSVLNSEDHLAGPKILISVFRAVTVAEFLGGQRSFRAPKRAGT